MSENSNTDASTTEEHGQVTETGTTSTVQWLPDDHPLVTTLEAQKTEIKDLKAKAKRLDQLEEAQKSDAEKATDRITKAEAEAASVPAKVSAALKDHLVALHEFDAEDAELFLTADDPELLLKQVTRLLDRSGKTRTKKNIVAREGENPSAATTDEAAFVRDFFGNNG